MGDKMKSLPLVLIKHLQLMEVILIVLLLVRGERRLVLGVDKRLNYVDGA